ncbi:MAG: glycoside hydrolase family 16 protein [Mesorhizobium sp.]|uniref:glycoside hydrolase family 16 protein n=1 Tax=Mesorhizobium sp. TaxID=1871066 RepID=UPI000FE6D623|nr:glycoside hydrolase family 16 protein [Mesorhizobium sp.]RWC56619.1 MAG: glycoside hydrolase family 16 protein [Mesorhizobium sp.]RWD15447.1 MAG: glycoside hydrolase family 16 protein [Mesorhizobium sp.]RWD56625.1 MAG: glycoside hydrolase family 16 protein [Mesorhizobium sp.]TIW13593.1 MAG: glycoside hydrolase family 16 protein [Mesorhizobium sp.]
MTLSAPAGFTSSDLVYEESFSGTTLDSDWHTYITSNAADGWPWNTNGSGGSTPGGPYNADYDMPSQVSVSDGTLNLTAIKQPISGVNQGGVTQTFPITSGAVSSYGNFEFNGGYLQISMKAPSGDGAWPGLWLMPGDGAGSSGDNFELDIQEGGFTGSGPADQNFSWHLHGPSGWVGDTIDSGINLTAGFHTYGINWVPGESITWYLDGKQMAQVTSAQVAIPDEPMQLMMNLGVANSNASGWHTALDGSTPSSMQMLVDEVQLYQKAGSGDTVTGANVTPSTTSSTQSPTTPTIQPAVTQVAASPATGVEHAGDAITMTVAFNKVVTVTGTPTLSLNDGGTASYVSGSGTSALTFRTTVASTDKDTSALAITGVNLPSGASIKDASGVAANLSGAVKTFSGLQIDPVLPAVTQATASPGTGTEHVGDTVTLTLGFNEAVKVSGTPTLSLNNGATATYVGGSGTSALNFRTTVASTDTNTSALAITGVNLTNGASIKDASGVAANLAGAVKTFSGLQIATSSTAPTTPTTPTTTTTPSSIAPVLTIADPTLKVNGLGGTVDLGVKVTTTDPNDVVTVNVTGLPRYETITDKLDGKTFSGKNITLTAAQVDSGLTLQSNYKGAAHPVATLTLTATAKDPVTGAVTTASPQSITVVDPRPATATTSLESLATRGPALLHEQRDLVAGGARTWAPHSLAAADHPTATGTARASLASQSFALLNQYLAGKSGRVDSGQIVAVLSNGASWDHDTYMTRPHH